MHSEVEKIEELHFAVIRSDCNLILFNFALHVCPCSCLSGETDTIKAFMVHELYPRINGALEDLFGKFEVDQLPTMVWVTHEVVTKVKINATIENIVSEVQPRDKRFTNLEVMHLVGKMFPARKCYQYYPLEPARKNVQHPTYAIQNVNEVRGTLFFVFR